MTAPHVQLLGAAGAKLGAATIPFTPDKRYGLLAYLAFKGDWVSRDKLAYLFWPEVPDGTARHSLRQLLKRVRKFDWLMGLETDLHRVRWVVATDIAEFKQALQKECWDEALTVYGGPLLKGMSGHESTEFEAWLELEREHLHSRWRETLLRYVGELEGQGRHLEAAERLARLLEQDDLDEDALRAYMSALFRAGRQARALRAYEDFAKHLSEELGLEPTTATEQLAQAVREADTACLKQLAPSPTPPHPPARTPGVAVTPARPALPTPATLFVGRDLELAEIAHLLSQPDCRILTLIGLGGVGKSRIALQAAAELTQRYEDGVYFVPLDSLTSAQSIPTEIATALSLTLQGKEEPFTQVARHLGEQHITFGARQLRAPHGGGCLGLSPPGRLPKPRPARHFPRTA